MTKQLSPAAKTVAKAAFHVSSFDPETYPSQAEEIAAAVLRAVALYCKRDKLILLSLAAELEGH